MVTSGASVTRDPPEVENAILDPFGLALLEVALCISAALGRSGFARYASDELAVGVAARCRGSGRGGARDECEGRCSEA